MDEELSEMLRVWGERGPTLISAVLEERKRLLDLAALHRDDLSAQLFESQNEITALREQVRELEKQHQNDQNQSAATIKQLTASISSLTKELQDVKNGQESIESELVQVTKERDKATSALNERERSAEDMMAALQKSMHSEAKAKSTARDSILNLRQENMEYSHLVVNHRLKAEKESRRADAAERKALELQEKLDKMATEKSITSEDRSRTHVNPKESKNAHSGTKRKFASSSKSEVMGPAFIDLPSEVTQNEESYHDRPTKRRAVTKLAEKRKPKVTETLKNNSDDLEPESSGIQYESGNDVSYQDRTTKKRVVRRSADKRRIKETGVAQNNDDDLQRDESRVKSQIGKGSGPRKMHEPRKRKTKALPTAKPLVLQREKKPLQSGLDPSQTTPSKYERPRRNLPKVSYIYPVKGDSDVQTRDSFALS